MHRQSLIIVIAVAAGIGIGALTVAQLTSDKDLVEGSSQRTAESFVEWAARLELSQSDPEQVARVVESLVQTLDAEIAERRVLEVQLEELRLELTDLQENLGPRVAEAFSDGAFGSVSINARNTDSSEPDSQRNLRMEARLAAAGFTTQQVATLRRRQAEIQMRQIDIDDRARREGWVNTSRYVEELDNLTTGLDPIRRDLGDDAYERYLFAIGRPNRVKVGTVIETSPAELAGFRPGDVIRSYGGERIFSSQQLTILRSTGDKGTPVAVEIIRDRQPMQITIPRGPMGIQTQSEIIDPSAPSGG